MDQAIWPPPPILDSTMFFVAACVPKSKESGVTCNNGELVGQPPAATSTRSSAPISVPVPVKLPPAVREAYDAVERDLFAEIEIAGVRVKAEASLAPMYDPKAERVRA